MRERVRNRVREGERGERLLLRESEGTCGRGLAGWLSLIGKREDGRP